MRSSNQLSALVAVAFSFTASGGAIAADGGDWTVSRSSGEVWLAGSDVQQVSLSRMISLSRVRAFERVATDACC